MQYLPPSPLLLLSELPQICSLWALCISLLSLFSNLPPSQGGRYVGFGSAPAQTTTDNSGKTDTKLSIHRQKFIHSLLLWLFIQLTTTFSVNFLAFRPLLVTVWVTNWSLMASISFWQFGLWMNFVLYILHHPFTTCGMPTELVFYLLPLWWPVIAQYSRAMSNVMSLPCFLVLLKCGFCLAIFNCLNQ